MEARGDLGSSSQTANDEAPPSRWISKPDEEPAGNPMEQKTKVKYSKGR